MRMRRVDVKAALAGKDGVAFSACAHPVRINQVLEAFFGVQHQAANITRHHGRIVGEHVRGEITA